MVTTSTQSLYRDIIKTRVESAIEMARVVKTMPHRGTLGEIRELLDNLPSAETNI
jgi:hypothetical protein